MSPETLRIFFEPILLKLYFLEPESVPFQEPVDPTTNPKYSTIVKNPMDLRTIEKKLFSNQYVDHDDFNLMFENSLIYNRKTSPLYQFTMKVRNFFVTYQ